MAFGSGETGQTAAEHDGQPLAKRAKKAGASSSSAVGGGGGSGAKATVVVAVTANRRKVKLLATISLKLDTQTIL